MFVVADATIVELLGKVSGLNVVLVCVYEVLEPPAVSFLNLVHVGFQALSH